MHPHGGAAGFEKPRTDYLLVKEQPELISYMARRRKWIFKPQRVAAGGVNVTGGNRDFDRRRTDETTSPALARAVVNRSGAFANRAFGAKAASAPRAVPAIQNAGRAWGYDIRGQTFRREIGARAAPMMQLVALAPKLHGGS